MQVSQEAGQVVCYSHLFQNFPHFVLIHTVKGFGIVNKAEIDVFHRLGKLLTIISSNDISGPFSLFSLGVLHKVNNIPPDDVPGVLQGIFISSNFFFHFYALFFTALSSSSSVPASTSHILLLNPSHVVSIQF